MTRFILAVALAGLAGVVRAGDFASPVILGVTSTMTIATVSIATQTPTDVIVSAVQLYRQVCIQNFDTTAFLSCSSNVNVSTLTANALMGVMIAPAATATTAAQPPCFEVVPGNRFYCLSSSVSAATRAAVIRKR